MVFRRRYAKKTRRPVRSRYTRKRRSFVRRKRFQRKRRKSSKTANALVRAGALETSYAWIKANQVNAAGDQPESIETIAYPLPPPHSDDNWYNSGYFFNGNVPATPPGAYPSAWPAAFIFDHGQNQDYYPTAFATTGEQTEPKIYPMPFINNTKLVNAPDAGHPNVYKGNFVYLKNTRIRASINLPSEVMHTTMAGYMHLLNVPWQYRYIIVRPRKGQSWQVNPSEDLFVDWAGKHSIPLRHVDRMNMMKYRIDKSRYKVITHKMGLLTRTNSHMIYHATNNSMEDASDNLERFPTITGHTGEDHDRAAPQPGSAPPYLASGFGPLYSTLVTSANDVEQPFGAFRPEQYHNKDLKAPSKKDFATRITYNRRSKVAMSKKALAEDPPQQVPYFANFNDRYISIGLAMPYGCDTTVTKMILNPQLRDLLWPQWRHESLTTWIA